MIVCPKCGMSLNVCETQDFPVDPETGEANSLADYDLTARQVRCNWCDSDVTANFTNEQGELDIDGGVWKLRTEPANDDHDGANDMVWPEEVEDSLLGPEGD